MSGGKVVACPRCGSCDPLDTQMQIDYWRGFKFCVMACVCGYGEAAPYCGDFESVSARFYRKDATDLAAAIARAEALRACLYEAVGDDAKDWESGDGWPIGRFLVPALAGDIETAASELAAYRAEKQAAIAAQQAEGES